MRKNPVLSTTTAPAATAIGANLALTLPPAEKSAISIPANESSLKTSTRTCLPSKGRNWPADLSEASSLKSPTGNSRSSRTSRICSPTAPVAPTTATLYFSFFISLAYLFPDSFSHFLAADKLAARIFDVGGAVAFVEHL